MGRQPTYDAEQLKPQILEWISEGKTLREYCRQKGKPAYHTVYDWMEVDKSFATRFAQARESGEDVIAQECLDIADNATNDWMERRNKKGEVVGLMVNSEAVLRSRLRVETRLKLLAKWNPKKYGDKVQQEVTGSNGQPLAVEIKFVPPETRPKSGDSEPKQ